MSQADQGNIPDASSNILVKRKRGRPRKYPKLFMEDNVRVTNTQNVNSVSVGNAGIGVPPGFQIQGRNGYQPHQAASANGTTDVMVGKVVSGVIDATFDGGYLLSVRVGNSPTTLRGVIFKPGRYMSVSAENDVAPDIQMIRRNAIPIPAEIYSHVRSKKPRRSRDAPRSVNHVASKGKHVLPLAVQMVSPLMSRGNLTPVILQPRKLSDGASLTGSSTSVAPVPQLTNGSTATNEVPLTSEPTSVANINQVPSVPPPVNGSIPASPMSTVGNQSFFFQGEQNGNGACNQPSVKSTRLPDIPFEKLVTEVVKRIDKPSEAPSVTTDIHIEGSKSSDNELENDMDQHEPLVIKPLQAIQPNDHSPPPPKPLEDGRNGKMSELLLQVLQESMRRIEVPQAEMSTTGSRPELDEAS